MKHHLVQVEGAQIHVVEAGTGPLVLLVHGFPELWYSWRHQLPALAEAGYRAAAIDVRGYGESSVPAEIEAYGMRRHVSDNVGVVDALGERSAVIVGHDWGSPIAANSALLAPDTFTAVALLSVPYTPRNGFRPTDAFALAGGDEEFYVSYFQEPGRAEAEIEPDVRGWLEGFITAGPEAFTIPRGARLSDRFTRRPLPPWLGDADLDVYVRAFERAGFSGALNRYRNVDRDWADLEPLDGAVIPQPSLFIGGERDPSTTWLADAIAAHPRTLTGLVSQHILEGAGHWLQQERPGDVNRLLIDWLRAVQE
ncbi:MAG TPA: alpha/beta hydrolase [Solirubrobacter sp.]